MLNIGKHRELMAVPKNTDGVKTTAGILGTTQFTSVFMWSVSLSM